MGIGRSKEKVRNNGKVSIALPEDVVEEILSRLPVKSLLRYKCVSKKWNALIESSHFTTSHLHRSDLNTCLLMNWVPTNVHGDHKLLISLLRNETSFLNLDLPLLHGRNFYVVGSSKGLVCVRNFTRDSDSKIMIVWNPATKKWRWLPKPTLPANHYEIGFEFIEGISDYKLVAIYKSYYDSMVNKTAVFKAQVYTRSTDSWGEIESFSVHSTGTCTPVYAAYSYTCTLNGVLYMPINEQNDHIKSGSSSFLLSFDLREEVYNIVSVPDIWIFKIFSWKNSLALLGLRGKNYEVWVMNHEDQSSGTILPWTKLFIYESQQPEFCSGSWKDDFIFTRNDHTGGDELFLYDPTSQKMRELSIIPKQMKCYLSSFNYVESLVIV